MRKFSVATFADFDLSEGRYSYHLFTVSEAKRQRIRYLHANYFQEMRRVVAAPESPGRAVRANLHLIQPAR